ncbi:hypothetical protein Pla52o_28450 [Novipirellula galeiformis]|uniref:Cytochrome C Planctomycete-type domain-containing protein n=1 Tax=Novipirellula galeiformis TaxID=2528004 RepID=A0A5C6CKF1_9BACT|nr:hypothetical protein [Novipirellula galeiformis]TWU23309.1 hypothetical protein Pla52o_28450 [Novipirellula galeiformis]
MWNGFPKRRALATSLLALMGSIPFASSDEPIEQSPLLRIVTARTNFAAESQATVGSVASSEDEVPREVRAPSELESRSVASSDIDSRSSTQKSLPASRPLAAAERSGFESQPCVLLNNGNVLFGEATQLGHWVIVKRDDLSEVQLSRQDVACWAGSIRDLYRYRIDHRGNGSLAARLEDARWCLRYDLYDLAAQELIMIYEIAPDHPEAKRIEQRLRRAAEATKVVEVAATEPDGNASRVSSQEWVSTTLASADRIRDFARFVQPLLINRCGQCHAHDTDRKWQLIAPSVGSRPSARMTQDNLKAALPFVDIGSPLSSEFLIKAQTPHGDESAGNDARRHATAATIQRWIESVHANVAPTKSVPKEVVPLGQFSVPEDAAARAEFDGVPSPKMLNSPNDDPDTVDLDVSASKPPVATKPERLPEISNPFDPDLFNRQFSTDK